ncbi:MAG: choloylglycine hydrolase family protein [Ruminococcaceae bacterium]|nr:choloylglycine hydrolase family protein [Oscillospiraceae bacterium]
MCTAISITVKDNYFGRNLDFEHTFGEKITITPRNYKFIFRNGREIKSHYAIIGMALPMNGYPLYFDASNEMGLSMAGLNFPDNAHYNNDIVGKENIASFEFIPWILTSCQNIAEAEMLLKNINITGEKFDEGLSPTPLHWIIADKNKTITVEQTKDGLKIYDNPVGVLTNNPPFDIQLFNLSNYMSVSPNEPENKFSDKVELKAYSRGMGGIGLPGDLSSMSRFVRASFTKLNSVFGETENEIVSQFFRILYSVYQQKGCVKVGNDFEITNYSSCCNTDRGIYYYTTYYNSRINAVDMNRENLDLKDLIVYNLIDSQKITIQNMKG